MEMDEKRTILDLLEKVADEQNYVDYTADIKRFNGDANMMSVLYNVTLSASGKPDLKLFVKVANMKEQLRQAAAFKPYAIELHFYSNLMKSFEALEQKYSLPGNKRIRTPKLYGLGDDYLKETLVLEDLAAQGFQDFNRAKSADMEYMSAGIDLMAKFHALSMAHYRADPKGFRQASESLAVNEEGMEVFFVSNKQRILSNALAATEAKHKQRLLKFFENPEYFTLIFNNYRFYNRNMLVHGDFKPSNLMHRRRNGKLELVLMDFQLVHEGDPVTDLMYFIFTATDEQFRRDHYHELLDLYYERLREALHNLHLQPEMAYPEKLYRMQLEECTMLGLVLAAVLLPVVLVEDDKAPAYDKEESELADVLTEGSTLFKERFNGIINNFVEWGLL